MYVSTPAVTVSTPDERLQALQDAKDLMSGSGSSGVLAAFGASKNTPGSSAEAINGFIRLAEYITTGHDYPDTHPMGKRRPIIKQITNVTVVDPSGMVPDQEDIEHFLHHVQNGDFADFLKQAMNGAEGHPEQDEEETEADVADKVEDEPEHEPQVDGDRPRFTL